jgi:hypothetical protein
MGVNTLRKTGVRIGYRLWVIIALTLFASACSNSDGDDFQGTIDLVVDNADRCDPLDGKHCLLPFPSDTFLVQDASTDTGWRVNFAQESLPVNNVGVHIEPAEWNRNDGFSPGSVIATYVDGLDVTASGIAPSTDIARSLVGDAPIVLIDTVTGERRPYWAELDASVSSDANRMLLVRPAVNLLEGHRHVVALRHLRNAAGHPIEAGDVFRAYRDKLQSNVPEVEARRQRYERVFRDLAKAGVAREDLYLAWDFTVASQRNLTERMLHIRDEAFATLNGASPAFTVTMVEEDVDDLIQRRVTGTFEVPYYLEGDGAPGTRFNNWMEGLPQSNRSYSASFICNIPHAAFAAGGAANPARAGVYGHGLLGSNDEVSSGNVRRMSNEHNFVFCATKWIGMSEDDVVNAVMILQDLSRFPTLADRVQQGFLNTLFLGRLIIHPDGLTSHEAFQAGGEPLIDTSDLFYDGNSQGGIFGGAATAVAIDWTRAVLGVTGMNYSTLLQRSSDWPLYRSFYDPSYPNEIERGLGLILIQMLWDRAETNGYAHHLTDDPLPGTPPHQVLMHIAFGDWQVAQVSADVQARTIGARLHVPAIAPGRLSDVTPYWGIEAIASYPYDGSAIVIFDSGTPEPPPVNLAPNVGRDPHGDPRNDPDARVQKSEFLRTDGAVIDVCGGAPCTADVN